MSSKLTHPSRSTPDHTQPDDVSTAELLALLGDEYTRAVLEAVIEQPRSGTAVTEAADVSKATAYRRLESLEEAGLVVSETVFDSSGHHHEQYRAVVEKVELGVEADGLTAQVTVDSAGSESRFPDADRRCDD